MAAVLVPVVKNLVRVFTRKSIGLRPKEGCGSDKKVRRALARNKELAALL
jgi:hypothetical protein